MGGVVVTVLDSWDVVSLSGGTWVAMLVGGVVIISVLLCGSIAGASSDDCDGSPITERKARSMSASF
jgi:hypothetical protein